MRVPQLILIVMSGLALAGCPKKQTTLPDATNTQEQAVDTGRTSDTDVGRGELNAEQAALEQAKQAGTIVYFDYDRAEIKPEYVPIVTAHAKYLNRADTLKVRLEGHSDERGSREYNIGLGERRAQAVRRALLLQGAGEPQLSTVSYGEERPAAAGSDETAWQRNRRVEIVYLQ